MSPVDQQFEILKNYHPEASIIQLPNGSHVVSVPNISLPPGWTKCATAIKFIAPVGYPMARPDCFWADADLRLINGNLPQNANPNQMPPSQELLLWFSWHLTTWNPNSDNLLTYVNVIKRRLCDPK
jgi:hypothetical protein